MQNSLSNMGIRGRFKQFAIFLAVVIIVALISKVIEIRTDKGSEATVQTN